MGAPRRASRALVVALVLWSAPVPIRAQGALPFSRVEDGDLADGSFSSPSASWVDVDGDGDEDLHVLNGYGSLEEEPVPQPDILYLNDGTGGFTSVPDHPLVADPTFSGSATWADYDRDGDLDVFVANQRGADNRLFRNDGAGGFVRVLEGPAVTDGGRSFSAVWVDIDGDGWLDLHVLNGRDGDGGEADFVYRNLGDGALERVEDLPFARESLPSGGAAWADYDADGDPDLFLPVHSTGMRSERLYRNDGGWRFTPVTDDAGLAHAPLPGWPRTSVAHWVDYDGDADLDLFVGNVGTIDFLYANRGDGTFQRVEADRLGLDITYVSDALWVDLDNDGDLDLVVAVWGGASEIYRNDGEGGMHPVGSGAFGDDVHFASSVSASDVDADGDRDLFLTQWPINEAGGLPNLLYRNEADPAGWIEVELEGTSSDRTGVGALILVDATIDGEARRQIRSVASRTSWRSANGHRQHFGLGDAEAADRIEVRWPSGKVDVVDGPIGANRRVTIVEGSGLRP